MSKRLTFAEYTKKQREEEEKKKKELEAVYTAPSQKTKAVSAQPLTLPTASKTAVSSDKGISFAEYTKREKQQQDKSASLASPHTPTLSLEQQRDDAKARAEQAEKAQKELREAVGIGDGLTADIQRFASGPARFLGDLLSINKDVDKVRRIETKEGDSLFNIALAGAQKLFFDQAERSARWSDALTGYADKAESNPYNRRLDYFKQQQYEADTEAKLLDAKILEEEIKSKPDFELKSGYVEPELPYMSFTFLNKDEKTYAAINDVNQRGYMIGGDVDSRLAKMTPDEIKVYNYLYNTGDKKQLKAYLDMLMPRLEKETAETMRETQRKIGEEHPIAASIVSVPTQVFGDVVSAGENIKNVFTGEVNPYSSGSVMAGMAQGMRGGVSSNIQQTVFDKVAADKMADGMSEEEAAAQGNFYAKAAAFFYSAGMSIADSTVRALGTKALAGTGLPAGIAKNAGLVSMASGVFQRSATEAKLNGATDSQAIALGIVYGGAEYLTERVELNTLMDRWLSEGADAALDAASSATGKEARKLLRQANFKYWLQNVYCEGREETISGIISSVGNIIIMGDQSEWTQAINAYMADGKDRQEAVKLAVFDKIKELGAEFVAGAISGGVMSGGAIAGNSAINAITDRQSQAYRDATEKTAQQVSEQIQRETEAAAAQVQAEMAAETAAQAQPTVDIGEAQKTQNQTAQAQAQPEIEVQPIDVEQAVRQADETVAYNTATALNNEAYNEWYNNLTTDSKSRVSQLRDTASRHGMNEHTTRQLEFLSDALNANIKVVSMPSEVGEDGARYTRNGYYRDGTLYINADTQEAIPFVAAHEMTHSMEGTDAYDKYRNYVLNHFKKSGSYEQLRNEFTNLYEQAGVNNVDIDGEIVAEFAGRHLFTDLNAITAMKNYDHSLVSRIRSWLSDMVTKLKGTPEQRTAAFFNRALDLYSRALQQSNRNVLPGTKTAETAQTAQAETGKITLPRATQTDAETKKAMEITDAYYDELSDDATSEEVWESAKKKYGIDTEYSISKELDKKYPVGNSWTVETATENNSGLKNARAAVATKINGFTKPADGDIMGAGNAQYSISPTGRVVDGAVMGDEGTTYINGKDSVNFHYAVIPAEQLITSHDNFGNANDAYPAELQPRDRGRGVSRIQIAQMAGNLNPALLADSPTAQNGAPIIRSDGVVVGGNARSIAINSAYNDGKKAAADYEQFIRDNAARFGIDPAQMPDNPVLVRIADGVSDWTELSKQLNVSSTSNYSTTERAENDAQKLTTDILWALDPELPLTAAGNAPFVAMFTDAVVPAAEQNSMINADGNLSVEGLTRIQNAVFAYAYKDTSLLQRLSESLDNDMKNVTNGLLWAANKVAYVNGGIEDGYFFDKPIINEIVAGVELYTSIIENMPEGWNAEDAVEAQLSQISMTGDAYGGIAKDVARFIAANKRSGKRIRMLVEYYCDTLMELGDPEAITFFGENENGKVTETELFRRAAERFIAEIRETDDTGRYEGQSDRDITGFVPGDTENTLSLPTITRRGGRATLPGGGVLDRGVSPVNTPDAGRVRGEGETGRAGTAAVADITGGKRFIDRQAPNFADTITKEAEKLGIIEKVGKQTINKQAEAEVKAQKEKILARAETKAGKVLGTAKANADQRFNKAKEAADAIVNQAVQYREMKRNEVQKLAEESTQRLIDNIKDKAESRKEAKLDAKIRRANLDIVLPTSVDEALKMYADLYKSEQVFKATEKRNRLNENDATLVTLLFKGDISVMDVYELGKESEGILQVFATLKEFDKLARTAKEWRKAVQGEYNAEADGYLEDLVKWKDHKMAMTYHKQTALRNFRDATKESPETTAKFEALEAEKRKANADMRTWRDGYADRARKLDISAKAIDLKSGNKMSEGEFIVRYSDLEQAIAKAEKEVSKRYGKQSKTAESAQLHYNQMVFNLETARRLGNAQSIAEAEAEVKKAKEMLDAAKADFGIEDDVKIDGRSYNDLTREMENLVNDWNETLYEGSDEGTWQYGDELTDRAGIAKKKLDALVDMYKEIAVDLNKTYVSNGYAPMGIIDRYTPVDFTDNSSMLNRIGRRLGIRVQDNELPSQIAGLTHSFTPGVTWFGNKLKRHTYFSKEMNPLETLDRYLTNAGNVIFLTEHIQKLRALERKLRFETSDEAYQKRFDEIWNNDSIDINEKADRIAELERNDAFAMNNFVRWLHEYTNQLAGKKSLFDRPFEEFGRNKMYKAAQALDKALGIGLVAGNIASAPTNLIPIAQVTAIAGTQNTARALAKTMEHQTRNLFGNERDEIWTASDFLKTRKSMEPIHKDRYDHIHDVGGFLFTACDSFAAEVVVRACYMHNIQQGMGEEAALRMADMQAGSVMADRSKGQLPTWFGAQNILSRTINKFQLEVANTVDFFLKDIKYYNKERDKTILGFMAFIFWSWMLNQALEMLTGRKPAQEPISIINDTTGAITGYKLPNIGDYVLSGFDSKQFKTKKQSGLGVAKTFIEGLISQLPYQSAIQIALDAAGVDNNISGGRIPIAAAVPNFVRIGGALFGKNSDKFSAAEKAEVTLEELSKSALILPLAVPFGIGAGQMRKTIQGAATMLSGGSYKINSKGDKVLQYPVDRSSPLQWLKALTLGKSSLGAARKWVDSDFNTLSAKETASYKSIVDLNGYNAALSALDAMEAVSKAGNIEEKISALNDSSLDSTTKIIIYRNNIIQDGGNEQALIDKLNGQTDMGILYDTLTAIRAEDKTPYKIQRLLSSGLDGDSRAAIYRELLTGKDDKDRALMDEFKGKVDAGSLADALMNVRIAADTPAKITAIQNSRISDDAKKRIFEVKISDSRADEMAAFKSAGLSLDDFFKSYAQYNNIYRSEEKPSVKAQEFSDWLNRQEYSDNQKAVIKDNLVYFNMAPATAGSYDKLYDAGLTADQSRSLTERLNALEPLPGEETVRNRQKWDVIVSEGLTVDEQLRAIRAHSYDTEYYRFKISNDYGVAPTDYLKFLDLLPAFDADGNGSMKQSEVQAALDSLGGGNRLVLSRPGDSKLKLTNEQKAVLWQVYTNGKDGKNNPYSTTTGKKVYDAMLALKDAAKAGDAGETTEEKKPLTGIVLPRP